MWFFLIDQGQFPYKHHHKHIEWCTFILRMQFQGIIAPTIKLFIFWQHYSEIIKFSMRNILHIKDWNSDFEFVWGIWNQYVFKAEPIGTRYSHQQLKNPLKWMFRAPPAISHTASKVVNRQSSLVNRQWKWKWNWKCDHKIQLN